MENENTGKNVPEKKFSTGVISATVWKNIGVTKTGEQREFRTVSLQRRYTDKNGTWKSTSNLRVNDLPKAALVLNKAYEYLVLKGSSGALAEEPELEEEIVM